MKFPNKVNSYKDTVIFAMPVVYDLMDKSRGITDLFVLAKQNGLGGDLVFDALTCLFAMNKIKIVDEGILVKC